MKLITLLLLQSLWCIAINALPLESDESSRDISNTSIPALRTRTPPGGDSGDEPGSIDVKTYGPLKDKFGLPFKAVDIPQFKAFPIWLNRLKMNLKLQETYKLGKIAIQAGYRFFEEGKNVGFLFFDASVTAIEKTAKVKTLAGAVFLRGPSVAILVVLEDKTSDSSKGQPRQRVALTVQPRVAIGSLKFTEVVAGIHDGKTAKAVAEKELEQELGLKEAGISLADGEMINLSELATPEKTGTGGDEHLPAGTFPSVGGSDEYIVYFLLRMKLPSKIIDGLDGRETGEFKEGEKINVKVVELPKLMEVAAWDGKVAAVYGLSRHLQSKGEKKLEGLVF